MLPIAPALLILLAGCDFPYRPEPQPQPVFEQKSNGSVFSVNTNQQVCNPSIAESDAYPASMLWLGFDQLSVTVPDGVTDYPLTRIEEHDRITVTDTSNTVRWSLMAREAAPTGEMQCPRWSAHPDYISFTVGIPAQAYSGYAVRVSDRRMLKICNAHLEEFSTPHAWIPDSIASSDTAGNPTYGADGFAAREDVQRFFGTTRFKFVYAMPETQSGALFFIDYSATGAPAPVRLPKPAGKESWHCESPQVSRDGDWIAFHCFQNAVPGYAYATYMQKLQAGALPILVADRASDPHWWVDPAGGAYHLVYSVTKGDYFTTAEFTDPALQKDGTFGATVRQRLAGSPTTAFSLDAGAKPDTLVRLPFKGGLSRDGNFLCTAYKYAYLMRIQ
ncbi:MAG: hypothetical protein ABIY63_02315 [Fibrobacteria bacterium]